LLIGVQVPRGVRLGPKPLDRIHDVGLLREEGIPHTLRPVDPLTHHGEDVWKRHQRLDAKVPALPVEGIVERIRRQISICLDPPVRLYDFNRVGGRHENLGKKGVGIQGDGRKYLVEFFLPENRNLALCKNRRRYGH